MEPTPPDPAGRPAPRLRQPDRSLCLPAVPLDRLLAEDDPARLVWRFSLTFDLGPLYDSIRARQGSPGRGATDPRLLFSLWLMATLDGVGSARRLDRLCDPAHG